MKTNSSIDSKFFVRRPRWGRRWALAGGGLLLALGWWAQAQLPSAGTDLYLREGRYRVVAILDPITFVCEPVDERARGGAGAPEYDRMTVRLLGVELAESARRDGPTQREALARTLEFLRACPDRCVELRFDPHRFDRRLVPLARVLDGERELNAWLLAEGVVRASQIPGMRSRPRPAPDPIESIAAE